MKFSKMLKRAHIRPRIVGKGSKNDEKLSHASLMLVPSFLVKLSSFLTAEQLKKLEEV